jgi:hypothetical protein
MRRMNASKAKKEASEKKVFLNQKIAHDKPFLKIIFDSIRQVRQAVKHSFFHPVNNNLIGLPNKVTL